MVADNNYGVDKMVWTLWYMDKIVWKIWYGQNGNNFLYRF